MILETTVTEVRSFLQNCKFRELCDRYFSPNFWWIIRGTSKLSGEYRDKEEFFSQVINPLNRLISPGWKMHLLEVYKDEPNNVLIVEMKGEARTIWGGSYNNEYCWIFQFDKTGTQVIKLTAYYDSLLVNETLAHQ